MVIDVVHSEWLLFHFIEVESYLRRNAFQVFHVQVHPVPETFDSALEGGKVHFVQAEETF